MRNSITALCTGISILALFAATTASAANASKEENIGVGTGAVVGAIAGGPVGFIVGAAIGAKIGDTMHQKSEKIEVLEVSLEDTEVAAAEFEADVKFLNGEVERLQTVSRPELIRLMQAGIDMDLLFRTDESVLTDATGARLTQLASALSNMPDVLVQLDGFADERGDETYNQALSEKRVEFVRSMFINSGVHPTRIRVAAHGEAAAADSSIDSLALERRVSVKLYIDGSGQVAANPN